MAKRPLLVAAVLAISFWSVAAQVPAPAPRDPPAPAPGGEGGRGRIDAAGQRGAGGGRGGGGRGVIVGGAQADDPAYANVDFTPRDPVVPATPTEQVERMWLPNGFAIAPVLADPDIEDPGQIAFDGNGRMFVLELRGDMRDLEATDQYAPISRISMHEDRDNNGVYETHRVFVDKLVLPRFVMPLGGDAILTMETNADEVWKFTDTNADGVADKKDLFATGFGRLTNPELQQSGLTWGLDNWMYSTVNQFRVRWTPHGLLKEPTGPNGAQWGVTQDNYGKMYFQGGGSGLPTYFQFPIHYGAFTYAQQLDPDLRTMWGAPVRVADGVTGMSGIRQPDGSVISTTAGAGNDVYRGDRLPKDLIGDYFYGEPVGRIVRRLRATNVEGLTQLKNFYPYSEFIRSIDPLFRPVDMTTAPDGTMYITDMYKGVVEEKQWNQPGMYIQLRIKQFNLDKLLGRGRIWRVTYNGMPRDTRQPRMLNETPAQLVAHLSHPNGWWRDTAQQLLILKQDKSVAPALQALARSRAGAAGEGGLARIHALWTLEGLGALDAALARAMLKDADPHIRIQAIRASETLYKAGDKSFGEDYKAATKDAGVDVVIQASMTLNTLKVPDAATAIRAAAAANKAQGVQLVANTILNPEAAAAATNAARGGFRGDAPPPPPAPAEQALLDRGKTVYAEVCMACHGADGRGEPMLGEATTHAPSLAASPRVLGHRDYTINVLLHGLSGPVNGQTYPGGVMVPMGANNDEWIASVASYIRTSFGNQAPLITPGEVARVRSAMRGRTSTWTLSTLDSAVPRQIIRDDGWKLSASHNSATAADALGYEPWRSGQGEPAGVWLQVALPREVMLAEVQFRGPTLPPGGGGGDRGRGGPGAATPAGVPASVASRDFQVQVSTDGASWSTVATATSAAPQTEIAFTPTRARFARVVQTGASAGAPPWAVTLLRLFEVGGSGR